MKNLVVDSGITVKWFVEESDSNIAQLIYDEYESGNLSLLAPDLIYAEYGNIIWKKQIFQGISATEAEFACKKFQNISFVLTPNPLLFDDAYRLAVKYQRTFYDSLYLALSVRENCAFVTADERFYNSVRQDFPQMILLASWR
ncbi:MAG: type II toxin-antitoxin system VapC family toxin [Pyrinomonadaceae bacterium]|nr:type II toxin-antitoxin system VapC family toxin [Pyrinomonadaceae bacterium]